MKISFLVLILILFNSLIFSQDKTSSGKFNGVLFGDYFYKVEGDSTGGTNQYSSFARNVQGFTVRRARLHYEHNFSDKFNGHIGIEANDKSLISGNMSFIVYDASIEWKNIFKYSNMLFGVVYTPTFVSSYTEKIYGYRGVEKTIADKNSLSAGIDLGILLKGTFDKAGQFGYNFMLGNGKGGKVEYSKYLKVYSSIYVKFLKYFITEYYFDYQNAENSQYKYTLKGLLGYKSANITIGGEVVYQYRNNASANNGNISPFGFSLYAKTNIIKNSASQTEEVLNIFTRYDYSDGNTNVNNSGYKENFISVGLDYLPFPNVHIIPNLWMTIYNDKSPSNLKRNSDIVPRLTFWYLY